MTARAATRTTAALGLGLLSHVGTMAAAAAADDALHRGLRSDLDSARDPSSSSSSFERSPNDEEQYSATSTTTQFWIISATIFLTLVFLFLLICKRYGAAGARLVEEGWVNNRASGELSEESYVQRVLRRRAEREEEKKECPEKRMGRLERRLGGEGVVMTVKEPDFIKKSDAEPAQQHQRRRDDDAVDLECGDSGGFLNENDDPGASYNDALNTSIGGISSSTASPHSHINLPPAPAPNASRPVPNCCAICLAEYEVDDTVAWSSNPACVHAFHKECIVEWLGKMQDGTPCPCCRQTFVELPDHNEDEGNGGRKRLHSDMTRGSSFSDGDVPAAFDVDRIFIR